MPQPAPIPSARFAALVRAPEALRDTHAMAVLLGGFLVAALMFGLGTVVVFWSGNFVLAAVLNFGGVLAVVSAVNASGIALMDGARARPRRTLVALLAEGALCFGKFLLVAVAAALGVALYLLALAALFYLCRTPFLGPLLLVVLLPLAVLLTAMLMAALFVSFALLAPALWAGHPIRGAIARLAAIARRRAFEVILSLLLLGLLVAVTAVVVGSFVFSATTQVGMVASGVLGADVMTGYGGGMAFGGGRMTQGGSGAALIGAAAIGMSLVFAVVASVFAALQLNGLCHIYLQAAADIDDADADGALSGILAAASETIRGAGEKVAAGAGALAGKSADLVRKASRRRGEAGPPEAPGRACPGCGAPTPAGARFCTRCGAPLEP